MWKVVTDSLVIGMIFCDIFTITNTKIVISVDSDGLPSKKESRTSISMHKPIMHSIIKYSFNNAHTRTYIHTFTHTHIYIYIPLPYVGLHKECPISIYIDIWMSSGSQGFTCPPETSHLHRVRCLSSVHPATAAKTSLFIQKDTASLNILLHSLITNRPVVLC
jgi:hypothetical protein